jgi:hypothetical protein
MSPVKYMSPSMDILLISTMADIMAFGTAAMHGLDDASSEYLAYRSQLNYACALSTYRSSAPRTATAGDMLAAC